MRLPLRRMFLVVAVLGAACGRVSFESRADATTNTADSMDTSFTADASLETCRDRDCMVAPAAGTLMLDTATFTGDAAGSCGGGGFADAVVVVDLPTDESSLVVAADLPATNVDTLIHIRRVIDDPASEVACDPSNGIGSNSAIRLTRPGAGRYFVFFDREAAAPGVIEAQVEILREPGGACSPAPTRDRCDAGLTCVSGQCAIAPCNAAEQVSLPMIGSSVTTTVDTAAATNMHAGTCGQGNDGGIRAREVTLEVQLGVAARLYISTDDALTDFDTIVYVRGSCQGMQLECDDDSGMAMAPLATASVIETEIIAAGTYIVFIDGFSWNAGTARVTLEAR